MNWRVIFEFLHRHRVLVQVGFVVLVVGGYLAERNRFQPFYDAEGWALDKRMQARSGRIAPSDLVIIGVGESAFKLGPMAAGDVPQLKYLKPEWPWDRRLWGWMTEQLVGAGAKVVVFDFSFQTPRPEDAEVGAIFAKYADRVAITATLSSSSEVIGAGKENLTGGEVQTFNEPSDDLLPDKGPPIDGVANVAPDLDGVEREVVHGYNSLLLAKPDLADDPAKAAKLQPDIFSLSWLAATKALGHAPARNPTAPMMYNFYGPATTVQTLLIEDVLQNWKTTFGNGSYFKNKYVFVGPISELWFKDNHLTPFGEMPGVEIQATAFYNLIHDEWLSGTAGWVGPGLAVVFGLTALLITLRVHEVLAKVGLLLGLAGLFVVVTQWLFVHELLVVPVVGAGLGLVVCGGFGTIYEYVMEQYERRRMLGVFESMVSPEVAGLVLADRGDFAKRLGGQRKELVVLFSDIRGFTAWSEKVGPEALVAQLNEYFLEMVGIIREEGGTVQKYIGDALMAAWGDVRAVPPAECAVSAVRSALRMRDALERLNLAWVGQPGREQLSFGVGINFGEGVVGQVGHPQRQEFTVMGDTVNLAARFESATKKYQQEILVGEAIFELTKGKFVYRLADKMQVMGKSVGVPVYTPECECTMEPPPGVAKYDLAVKRYFARQFEEAEKLFRAAGVEMGGNDYLCENFADRAAYYATEPPPEHWDGTWVLKEK